MASQSDQARRLKLLLGQDVVPHSSEATAATSPAPAVPSPASTSVSRPGPAEVRWYSDSEESEEASSSSSKKGSSYNHPEVKKGAVNGGTRASTTAGLVMGTLDTSGQQFCPLTQVLRYPWNWIGKANREKVTTHFFDNGNFYRRPWDFYYIYPPSDIHHKALIMIPVAQVTSFLEYINQTLGTSLCMPVGAEQSGLLVDFPSDGCPQPRVLGYSRSPQMAYRLKESVPAPEFKPADEVAVQDNPDVRTIEAYRAKILNAIQSDKNKKVVTKIATTRKRHARQQEWTRNNKAVQTYLGLREDRPAKEAAVRAEVKKTGLVWGDHEEAVKAELAKFPPVQKSLDPLRVHPYEMDKSIVFVCVDAEAWEKQNNLITEIGVATLDVQDIIGTVPGRGGENWRKAIRARHFRINEHSHLRNGERVADAADKFEFGKSEFIALKDAKDVVGSCFKHPFSKNVVKIDAGKTTVASPMDALTSVVSEMKTLEVKSEGDSPKTSDPILPTLPEATLVSGAALPKPTPEPQKRNVVFVGHEAQADIKFLNEIGFDIYDRTQVNLVDVIDTANMYRAIMRIQNSRSLGSILAEEGICGWNLHNAGNDAAYTLQLMLSLAIRGRIESLEKKDFREVFAKRIEDKMTLAGYQELELADGWSENEKEGKSA